MSKHLKRLNAPRILKISRKEQPWVTRPNPGPHKISRSIAMAVVLRDILNVANKAKEAKKILVARLVLVDGRVVRDPKRAVGLMDVIYFKTLEKYYRVIFDIKGFLRVMEIPKEEGTWKLVRIENKHTVTGGKTQLALHDGKTIVMDECNYKPGDVLKVEIPTLKIIEHYPFRAGSYAFITGGGNIGKIARIEAYVVLKSPASNIVKFKEGFKSTKEHVFVIGTSRPEIKVPEVRISD